MTVREIVMGSAPKAVGRAALGCAVASVRAAAYSHWGALASANAGEFSSYCMNECQVIFMGCALRAAREPHVFMGGGGSSHR